MSKADDAVALVANVATTAAADIDCSPAELCRSAAKRLEGEF